FQYHEHALVEVPGNLLAGRDDVAHVRVFGFTQRRGDADIYSIEFGNHAEVSGGAELTRLDQGFEDPLWNIGDVGLARVDFGYLRFTEIDSDHFEPGFDKLDSQGQSDVSQT